MSNHFFISAWRAWAPCDAHQSGRQRGGPASTNDPEPADVSFLPAMQRRRLSPLAKAAVFVSHPLLAGRDMPLLCCSVHGEAQRTYSLLGDVASGESLSPTAFGLSVHNAIAGQLSMLCAIKSPALALAGGELPLQSGLLEAVGILAEGVPELLLLFCEEPLPELYRETAQSPAHTSALALHLCAAPAPGSLRCELLVGAGDTVESAFDCAAYQLPLISALSAGGGRVPLGENWELQIHEQ